MIVQKLNTTTGEVTEVEIIDDQSNIEPDKLKKEKRIIIDWLKTMIGF